MASLPIRASNRSLFDHIADSLLALLEPATDTRAQRVAGQRVARPVSLFNPLDVPAYLRRGIRIPEID